MNEMTYYMGEELLAAIVSGMFSVIPSVGFGLVTYVLSSLGLYTLAKRRGIKRPWLAWIPVVNVWILGSLSDQYRYVAKGEIRAKRKAMLTLSIIGGVISAVVLTVCGVVLVQAVGYAVDGYIDDRAAMGLTAFAMGVAGLALVLSGVQIALTVIRYFALYDLFCSTDPENKVLYILLSILISVTEPFFVFFLRNKDNGMPPRKEEPAVFIPPQSTEEPWDNNQ